MDDCKRDLSQFLIKKVPPTLYYIPNFITEAEEAELMKNTYSAPKPKWTYLSNRQLQNWGGLPHSKGMIVESLPEWLGKYARKMAEFGVFEENIPNHVLINEYLPGQGIMPHEDGSLFYPTITTINLGSHTVLNYYHKRGDENNTTAYCNENKTKLLLRNMAHKTATKGMNIQEMQNHLKQHHHQHKVEDSHSEFLTSVLLERRSLLIAQNDLYHKYLHGIEEKKQDDITENIANLDKCCVIPPITLNRETRISLTIRFVPKTFKTKLQTLYKNFK